LDEFQNRDTSDSGVVGRVFLTKRIIEDLFPWTPSETLAEQTTWSLVEMCVLPSERMCSLGECFRFCTLIS